MTNLIRIDAELSIMSGKLDELKELINAVIEKVEATEPNTLHYEWYLSEDGSQCCVSEAYKDPDALMVHLRNVGALFGPISTVTSLIRLKIYGNPSDEVRHAFASRAPQYFEQFNGVTRSAALA